MGMSSMMEQNQKLGHQKLYWKLFFVSLKVGNYPPMNLPSDEETDDEAVDGRGCSECKKHQIFLGR